MACTLTVIVPAPAPPPGTPGEPPAVRRPYDVWKSALIGGFLGGIFLLELIVLAVRSVGLFIPAVQQCGRVF